MRKIYFLLLVLCYSPLLSAEEEFEKFKTSFSDTIKNAETAFEKSKKLKPFYFYTRLNSDTLTTQDCILLEDKIRANYSIDPFYIDAIDGTSIAPMCSSKRNSNQLILFSGLSNLNRPFEMIIERYFPDEKIYSYVFLDQSFRIVEIQWLKNVYYLDWDSLKEKQSSNAYVILSQDELGNTYLYDYFEDDSTIKTFQKYLPSDGSSPNLMWKEVFYNKQDPSKNYEENYYSKADKKDWSQYEVPITHAWLTGFYKINGDYYFNNEYFSVLVTKLKYSDNKTCAWGYSTIGEESIMYPIDKALRAQCALEF